MSITKQTIKRLERELEKQGDQDKLIIPILATPAEERAIRARAKREGRKVRGIPIRDYTKEKNKTL